MNLDKNFWNERYETQTTGWDLGEVSPPIAAYFSQVEDKNIRILIPGCGNAHEAKFLVENGFTNITLIDIAPLAVTENQKRFADFPQVRVIEGDFFEHKGEYDLMLEQTFFCAIPPSLRIQYIEKSNELLVNKGKLVGVLFNTTFANPGPPFGGSLQEYQESFAPHFQIITLEPCYNSAKPRAGSELFIILKKL